MNLGYTVADEVGVDPQNVVLLRHSNRKVSALRKMKCDLEHDYTLVQPTDSKYDFYAAGKPLAKVLVVIIDDAVYAVYSIAGIKCTGTIRSLTSPAYNRFYAQEGYADCEAREFTAVKLESMTLNSKVIGWTSPRNAVARYGGSLFENVRVSI